MKGGAKTTAFSDSVVETGVAQRLAAFQKLGFCVAYLVECPLDAQELAAGAEEFVSGAPELARRFSPTLLKRIRFSYRPKYIALLSPATRHLISSLEQAGMGQALLLNDGVPWDLGGAGSPDRALAFRTLIEVVLAAGASKG